MHQPKILILLNYCQSRNGQVMKTQKLIESYHLNLQCIRTTAIWTNQRTNYDAQQTTLRHVQAKDVAGNVIQTWHSCVITLGKI